MKKAWLKVGVLVFVVMLMNGCQQQFQGFEKAENGTYYKIHVKGSDEGQPKVSDWIVINMNYRLKDSMMFKSQDLEEPLRFPIIEPMFDGDLYDGLMLMGVGDSMTFAVVADSFFFKTAYLPQLPPNVTPGETMYYDVKLLDRKTKEEHQEEVQKEGDRKLKEEFDILYTYLKENQVKTEPTASGLYFIDLEPGRGRQAVAGEMVSVYLKVSKLDGTELFTNFDGDPFEIEMGKEFDTKGLMEGLGLMREGGKSRLIVPSEIGVGPSGKDGVPPFTTIIYEVKLDKIKSLEQVKKDRKERESLKEMQDQAMKEAEPGRIRNYLAKNEINDAPLASGLYFLPVKEGTGSFPTDGNKVKVHYILHNLDGDMLQSSYDHNQAFEFVLGTGAVIKGWEEAVRLMNKGAKAKIIVPSSLAYGARDRSKGIPAYSPLVFDLELMEID